MCKPPLLKVSSFVNPLEQRVAKKVNGQITEKYLWADLTTLLAVYDANDNLVQRYNYTDQRVPTSMTMNNETYYLHYDQVGTLRAITDQNHNIIKEITYDTFGNIIIDTDPDFTIPFGFAGGLQDQDTNLVHFGYREYDPYTGKWTTKDPIDFSGGDTNLYGYVLNDPVNFVDPEGLEYTRGPFIPYNGSYNCKDCEPMSYAICGVGGYGLGVKGFSLFMRDPELFYMTADMIYGGLSPEPPTTPTQAIGAGISDAVDATMGN